MFRFKFLNQIVALGSFFAFLLTGCKKKDEPITADPHLVVKFVFDSTQVRLDNFGQAAGIPVGHAAQHPTFRGISAHYMELSSSAYTPLGEGEVFYQSASTDAGGETAIDFSKSIVKGHGEDYLKIPLRSLKNGTYNYLRVSLAYQKYDIVFNVLGLNLTGTVASFIGYNTYISTYQIEDSSLTINGNRKQGYWGLETDYGVYSGQAPEGATTVPNPLSATSPVPPGSCVVTGTFDTPLVITGEETNDIVITISLSTNNSFEWVDDNNNGVYEPAEGEEVVDMGIRGMIPSWR